MVFYMPSIKIKKRKYFINFIHGYFKSLHFFSKDENYHLHAFSVAQDLGYECIAIVNGGGDIMKKDPNLMEGIKIIEFKNYFQFIFLLFRFGIKSIFNKTIFYTNGHSIWSYITIIFGKIFSFGKVINIFMAHTHPIRGGLGKAEFKQFFQDKFLFKFFVDRIRLNNITEKEFLLNKNLKEKQLFISPLVADDKTFYKVKNLEERQDLVYFGQLTFKKNITNILKAFKEVVKREEYYDLKLHIIGKEGDNYSLEKDLINLDLKNSVVKYGFVSHKDLNNILNNFLIYLNDSKDEGQCLAVYEAALTGNALCLPNIMSFKDIFKGKALIHEMGNSEELAKNILTYLNNRDLLKEYNEKAVIMTKEEYSKEVVDSKMKELFY